MKKESMAEIRVENRKFRGPHGDVPVRVYSPVNKASTPRGLIWVHGGAFIGGDLDMPEADWVSRALAESGVTVVSVEYQLAPWPESSPWPDEPDREGGVHFPVASEEVGGSLEWARTTITEVAPDAWSLGGASAGGNLVAGATMRMVLAQEPLPRSTVLVYPLLHKALPALSEDLVAALSSLPRELRFEHADVAKLNLNYVGDPDALDDPRAFPGGHDLRGFPPVLLLNAEKDLLRASGDAFAVELIEAGIETHVIREAGTMHGFLNDPDHPAAAVAIERMVSWLERSV